MAATSAEDTRLWQASGGPFTVLSPERHPGYESAWRVPLDTGLNHQNVARPRSAISSPQILFHPPGWRKSQCPSMEITYCCCLLISFYNLISRSNFTGRTTKRSKLRFALQSSSGNYPTLRTQDFSTQFVFFYCIMVYLSIFL